VFGACNRRCDQSAAIRRLASASVNQYEIKSSSSPRLLPACRAAPLRRTAAAPRTSLLYVRAEEG